MTSPVGPMRHISESVAIDAPAAFALASLKTSFLERTSGMEHAQIRLEAPLPVLSRVLTIGTLVDVEVHARHGFGNLTIAWHSHDRAFPNFDGVLDADSRSETAATLCVSGEYRAPGAIAGAIFDAIVGRRIARATLRQLLEQFRNTIEADYRQRCY